MLHFFYRMKPNFMLDGAAMTTKFQHLSEGRSSVCCKLIPKPYTVCPTVWYRKDKVFLCFVLVPKKEGTNTMHSFGCHGSRSYWECGSRPKFTNKPGFLPFKKALYVYDLFCLLCDFKIWLGSLSALVWLPGSGSALRRKLDRDPLKPMRIHNTGF